ncbi:GNAT family N-acetyltransferase [Silicimonas algicola]|uniref:Acetyltransferase (GNAT) family protein n=1 Tax=Silicimonas algicola TaxID=1826607 RepID=A0A316G253_9RHOB|nr:GNAT family N-acetyltransferase [Silicimonas algicola]AZQ65864.1 GNAT family N-acetyltransferase [Silicimonas algicola]PWK54752.1 acetyltransferase (GNAT) family protein [Silicimonas algicola]
MALTLHSVSRDRWHRLSADAPFQQSWSYGAAAEALGADVLRLEVREGPNTIAIAQGIGRRIGVRTTLFGRGPLWTGESDDGLRADVLRVLRRETRGIALVTPHANDAGAVRSAGFFAAMTPATVAEWRLGPDMRARIHGKWRNRLCAAEASGVTLLRSRRGDDLRWLVGLDREQQRRKGFRALPPAFLAAWMARDPRSVRLTIAHFRGERVAAILVLSHGTRATYHIGWSGGEGRRLSAHNLLLWEAAQRLSDDGVSVLDLGLVDTETAPGLARFKLGTGAMPVRTGGTWIGLPRFPVIKRARAPEYPACPHGSRA